MNFISDRSYIFLYINKLIMTKISLTVIENDHDVTGFLRYQKFLKHISNTSYS